MARMCLVAVIRDCYCADSEVCSSPEGSKLGPSFGGDYASHASLLRGNWLCGGPLDFQAAASGRSGDSVSVSGPFVKRRFFRAWARAPLRIHFVSARPVALFLIPR
jgi:hypothetical protein